MPVLSQSIIEVEGQVARIQEELETNEEVRDCSPGMFEVVRGKVGRFMMVAPGDARATQTPDGLHLDIDNANLRVPNRVYVCVG